MMSDYHRHPMCVPPAAEAYEYMCIGLGYVGPDSGIGRIEQMRRRQDRLRTDVWQCEEGGKIALRTHQMDCDCATFTTCEILDADWRKVGERIDEIYQHAEGPVTWMIDTPSGDVPRYEHKRDLALEAYENGHPHTVTYEVEW